MGVGITLYIECKRDNESEWKVDPRHYIMPLERKKFADEYPGDPFAPQEGDTYSVDITPDYFLVWKICRHSKARSSYRDTPRYSM